VLSSAKAKQRTYWIGLSAAKLNVAYSVTVPARTSDLEQLQMDLIAGWQLRQCLSAMNLVGHECVGGEL
jgi:hypothetical protein